MNLRVLKEIWQKYLQADNEKEKEEWLRKFLDELTELNDEDSEVFMDSELTSISNLLGHELLKVVSNQCELVEDSSAFVKFLQQGTGLYLLQALTLLAEYVENCGVEVSNLLVSLLPCLLAVPCELNYENASTVLQKLTILYQDLTNGKTAVPDLHRTIQSCFEQSAEGLGILELFALLLDIICRLSTNKGCSLAIAGSTVNIAEKLTFMLHLFASENREPSNVYECTWSQNVRLVCLYMVTCLLWTSRNIPDTFSYRLTCCEHVEKMTKILKDLRSVFWMSEDGFKKELLESKDFLVYHLFLVYSLLGLLLDSLDAWACSEAASFSGIDSSRKMHFQDHFKTFSHCDGIEFIHFVAISLNRMILIENLKSEVEDLLKRRATAVITATGHLVSSFKKAMITSCKPDTTSVSFSLNLSTSTPRFSHVTSTSSMGRMSSALSESSDEEDWKLHKSSSISPCHSQFKKDCAVSCLCDAILSVYTESMVEDMDIACLNSLARCGTCQCMDISSCTSIILSRLAERSEHVQNLALRLLGKILLHQNIQANISSKQVECSRSSTDEVFSNKSNYTSIHHWPCFQHLASIVIANKDELTVKILKYLKALSKLAPPNLKEALFLQVFLPFVMTYNDAGRTNILTDICRKLTVTLGNPYDSGYGTPADDLLKTEKSTPDSDSSLELSVKLSEEALKISLTTIYMLLEKELLRNHFIKIRALNCIVSFLGDESLHRICLGILELLACTQTPGRHLSASEEKTPEIEQKGVPTSDNQSQTAEVIGVLLRSMFLLDPRQEGAQKTVPTISEFAPKIRICLHLPKVSHLLCQLWRTCLRVMRRSTLFRESFVKFGGHKYVVAVLQVIKEYFYKAKSGADASDYKQRVISYVMLVECAMAVGLEFGNAHVDGVKLLLQVEETVRVLVCLFRKDCYLKELVGKTFCQTLLNLAVGAVTQELDSVKTNLRESEKTLFDFGNTDDSESENETYPSGSPKKKLRVIAAKDVEPGYEGDAELENGMSDVSGKGNGLGRCRKAREKPKRRAQESSGCYILHPNMCEFLVHLIEQGSDTTVKERPLALFGLEGLINLASYSNRNREILCDKGLLSLILEKFAPCLSSTDIAIGGVQKSILDLIVVLAGYEIRCEELKMFLKLLENDNTAWSLILKALRSVTKLSVACHGPLYAHKFFIQTTPSEASSTYSGAPMKATNEQTEQKVNILSKSMERKQIGSLSSYGPNSVHEIFPFPWDIAALELKVNQTLPWPVGTFSLAFWLYLESGKHLEREHHARTSRGKNKTRSKHRRKNESRNEAVVHVATFGTKTAWFEVWVNFVRATLTCRWSYDESVTEASISQDISPLQFPLKAHNWCHVVLSVQAGQEGDVSNGKVALLVDGANETMHSYRYPSIPVKRNESVSLVIGQWISDANDITASMEKPQMQPYCKLGNVSVFIGELHRVREEGSLTAFISKLNSSSKNNQEKRRTVELDEAAFLHLLGANCQALDYHFTENSSENFCSRIDFTSLERLSECAAQSFVQGPHGEPVLIDEGRWSDIKTSLKKQLLLVYSPAYPTMFYEYKLEGTNWPGSASQGDVITDVVHSWGFGATDICRRRRLPEAIHGIGGIEVFLFLFAKAALVIGWKGGTNTLEKPFVIFFQTVERTKEEKAQADALSIILTLAKENVTYAKELDALLANKMILKVLLTSSCYPGYHFAKVFFHAACHGEVFRESGLQDKPFLVNFSTNAVITNFEILRDFLLNWRIWRSAGAWEMVLMALEALSNSYHPFSDFNIRQFERADALDALLLGCQEVLAEEQEFSSMTTSLHLRIIQNLLGCSASPRVLKRICEFLVAVHPTYETLVTHAPGNLYLAPIAKLEDPNESFQNVDEETEDGASKTRTSTLSEEATENSCIFCSSDKRTNVLETDDSKDMIITVGHISSPVEENDNLEFPLQVPEVTIENDETASSSPLDKTDNSEDASVAPGDRSEPIEIAPHQPPRSFDSYDVVSSSEYSATKVRSSQATNSGEDYVVVDSRPGHKSTMTTYRHFKRQRSELQEHTKLDELRTGLLELIDSALVNMADILVDNVIAEAFKFEYFLCFVNYPVARIRTLSIQILSKILERGLPSIVTSFHEMSGHHLLAVQIHLHPVTQELAEACFRLFLQQPVSINQPSFLESIKHGGDVAKKVNVLSGVPLLGILEGSVSCPEVFQFLAQSLVKVLDVVEDFLLKAADHGLLKTFVNAVRALCVWNVNNSDDRTALQARSGIIFDHMQYLVMAIVYRALRMCGDRYSQIFDDLLLALDTLQYSELGDNSNASGFRLLLIQCSRFLQHCALRFALEYLEHAQKATKINRLSIKKALRLTFKTTSESSDSCHVGANVGELCLRTLDPSAFPVLWKTSRFTPRPAEATQSEITARFHLVCVKAVNLICYSDVCRGAEAPWDIVLNYSRFTLPEHFETYKQADACFLVNADEIFKQWTFCLLLEFLDFALHDGARQCFNKWQELICYSKDKIRHQLCRLFIHLLAPKQPHHSKLFALQLSKPDHGNSIFLNLLLGGTTTKQKERAVAYVRSFLQEPEASFSLEEKEVRKNVEEFLKNVEEQRSEDWDSGYFSQREEEWEKQDHSNKIQWENTREVERKKCDQEFVQLCDKIMKSAMEVTKVSVDVQDKQRQNLLKHVKTALSNDVQSHKLWQMLIMQVTHERAIWHDKEFFPTSWQLDRTEGPCRIRSRLQRCHLDIDQKYVMPEYRKTQAKIVPLSYLFEDAKGESSAKNVYHIFNTTDTICFLHRCKSIMPSRKVPGEILIGQKRVYFVGEEYNADINTAQFFLDDEDITSVSWLFQEVREILRRRYALKDNALEIFLTNGRTFLLAFETTKDRETVYKELLGNEMPNLVTTTEHVADLTQRWQNDELTNFAYLTEINKQACRSFNDLMQYPVFPLVLAEYKCDVLDLADVSVYRDFSKPIAVQNSSRIPRYQETYKSLEEQYSISKKLDPMNCIPPYHYGSHYSNSGTVLHFLVRLVPYTKMFLTYQDRQFDVPDRTFHAIETTWNLSSFASAPDVKELTPEFFFLPEFLLNSEGFDFGVKQNGDRVMDVRLPSWACDDPRLFIFIHRQALESDVVSQRISKWIDLVFGFKQDGQAAIDAINVFHPSTYVGGIDENKLEDPLQRSAVQTMIETYGQTPAKVFSDPHPDKKRSSMDQSSSWSGTFRDNEGFVSPLKSPIERRPLQDFPSPVPTVCGIKWGRYVGSPAYPKPVVCWSDSYSVPVARLVSFPHSNLFVLPPNATHVIVSRTRNRTMHIVWSAVLSWSHLDDMIRVWDIKKGNVNSFKENINFHQITCGAVSEQCRSLWLGSSTGCLNVWPTRFERNAECGLQVLGRRIRLQGHDANVTCIEISGAFSIVVTGSMDCTAIIWDLNRLCYIRCLRDHSFPVRIVSVSPTSGDIVTVCHTNNYESSELRLWSVNGRLIKKIICEDIVTCATFSRAAEGVSVNALAVGLNNGTVRLWNTWTLDHICDIKDETCQFPLVSLAYSYTSLHLFTLDSQGTVRAWGRTERASYKPRILFGNR